MSPKSSFFDVTNHCWSNIIDFFKLDSTGALIPQGNIPITEVI